MTFSVKKNPMPVWKRIFLSFILFTVLVQQQEFARAQAAPIFAGVMNRAIGKAIATNLTRRGVAVAANDAVFARTMTYVGTAANDAMYVSSAVTTVAAVAGAPVWLTVALGLGAVAAVGAIAFGAYKLTQNSASTSMSNGQPLPSSLTLQDPNSISLPPAKSTGFTIWRDPRCDPTLDSSCAALPSSGSAYPYTIGTGMSNQVLMIVSAADAMQQYSSYWLNTFCGAGSGRSQCNFQWVTPISDAAPGVSLTGTFRVDYMRGATPDGNGGWTGGTPAYNGGSLSANPTFGYTAPVSSNVTGNLPDVLKAVKPSDLTSPVPDALVAQVANSLWKNAASKPGYDGVPYSVTDPITAADIATMRAADPSLQTNWNDMVNTTPNQPGNPLIPISPDPIPLTPTNPGTNTGANPGTSTGTNPKPDLGPDPGTPEPTLETTPTGSEILRPITGLFPELRSFQTPGHAGECPKPVFNLFGKSITMDSHCTIAEQYRSMLAAVMMSVWLLIGLFILLSA